jgi:hypothetical protein
MDANAARLERRCQRAHEPDHGVLRQRVDRIGGVADQARDRGGRHDRASAASLEQGHGRARTQHDPIHVDRQDASVALEVERREVEGRDALGAGGVGGDAGIQERDVDAAVARPKPRGDLVPARRTRDVKRHELSVELLGHRAATRLIDVGDHDVGAFGTQALRRRSPDAGRAARDQRHLARELRHRPSPLAAREVAA